MFLRVALNVVLSSYLILRVSEVASKGLPQYDIHCSGFQICYKQQYYRTRLRGRFRVALHAGFYQIRALVHINSHTDISHNSRTHM